MMQMRSGWLSDGESTPDDVAGLEGRIEAHVDALCLGGQDALDAAHDAARPDDPWSLYAWVAVACRADGLDPLRDALAGLERFCAPEGGDVDPTMLREAVADALIHHLPQQRVNLLAQQLHQASPHVISVLVHCIGARFRTRTQRGSTANLFAS